MSKKILVVDDEEMLQEIFDYWLEELCISNHLELIFKEDGAKALSYVNSNPDQIEFVISDINMPLMNGVELVNQLAQVTPNTPCMIMTAYDKDQYFNQIENEKLIDFISKPIDFNHISETIIKTLNLRPKESSA